MGAFYYRHVDIDTDISNGSVPGIPKASLFRLPQYHYFLTGLRDRGIGQVSCSIIGRELDCIPVQVRKDLQYTGAVGRPKTGYSVPELIRSIEKFLGWDNTNQAFLAGVGNLGAALLGHERFSHFGLRIVAAFDSDSRKVGSSIRGKTVLPVECMAELAHRMGIHLGIITAPSEFAQGIADEMVKGGIQAIWNFAPLRLKLPENVILQNEDLYSSLAALSWKLARRFQSPGLVAHKQSAKQEPN
jgi:redox-sensing transcriptional repressor